MKNTSSNHTPGPWTAVFGNGLLSVSVQSADSHICSVLKLPCLRCEEAEANVRLIAAAPELLLIAIAYRNLLKTMAHTEEEVATFNHINAVIAAAGGEL